MDFLAETAWKHNHLEQCLTTANFQNPHPLLCWLDYGCYPAKRRHIHQHQLLSYVSKYWAGHPFHYSDEYPTTEYMGIRSEIGLVSLRRHQTSWTSRVAGEMSCKYSRSTKSQLQNRCIIKRELRLQGVSYLWCFLFQCLAEQRVVPIIIEMSWLCCRALTSTSL